MSKELFVNGLNTNFKLCYVSGCWAYFTTLPLSEQWGDDWNDAPYEHNAGEPYTWREGDKKVYSVYCVAFKGPFNQPYSGHSNSPYSVELINKGAIAWLRPTEYSKHGVIIPAGTTLPEFISKVKEAKGQVYIPVE